MSRRFRNSAVHEPTCIEELRHVRGYKNARIKYKGLEEGLQTEYRPRQELTIGIHARHEPPSHSKQPSACVAMTQMTGLACRRI